MLKHICIETESWCTYKLLAIKKFLHTWRTIKVLPTNCHDESFILNFWIERKEPQKDIIGKCFQENYTKIKLLFQSNSFETSFMFFEIPLRLFNFIPGSLHVIAESLLQNKETIFMNYPLKGFSLAENS